MSFAYGFGLPHYQPLSGGFSPASLFTGGVQGAWYDPSDATTLFSDRAGTTPCATPGAGAVVPVGLMLDKSQGLVLGSEALTNPGPGFTATTGWTSGRAATLSVASGTIRVTNTVAYGQAYQAITTVVGTTYKVTATVTNAATLFDIFVGTTGPETGLIVQRSNNAAGTYTFYFTATTTTSWLTFGNSGATAGNSFDLVSATLKALPGNHAVAANDTTARPELSARVNLLTRTEEFENAAWSKGALTVSANATTAPDGTTTADKLQETTANAEHYAFQSITAAATPYTFSVYLKAAERTWANLYFTTGSVAKAYFDLANGVVGTLSAGVTAAISDAGNGWWRCQITVTATATTFYAIINPALGDNQSVIYAGTSGSGIFAWGADLRPTNIGSQIPAYQRVVDANTYDSAGFPRRLVFNGTSSAMSTPANVNLSGTDKVAVFAGVRKNSTAFGTICETGAGGASGSFALFSNYVADDYAQDIRGTGTALQRYVTYAAPITNVYSNAITSVFANSAAAQSCQINGIANAGSALASASSTGNFASRVLNIGARNAGASLFLNGDIYSLIVVGSAVSAGSITATEQYVNGKVGGVY